MPGIPLQACPLACGALCLMWRSNSDSLRGPCVSTVFARGIACPRSTGRMPTGSGPWDCMLRFPPSQRSNRGRHAPGSRRGCTRGRVGRHSVTGGPAGPRFCATRSTRIVRRRVAMQHPRYSANTVWRHLPAAACRVGRLWCLAKDTLCTNGDDNNIKKARMRSISANQKRGPNYERENGRGVVQGVV